MKTTALVLALLGVAWMTLAAEPSTNTITAPATSLWAKAGTDSGQQANSPPATEMQAGKVGDRLDPANAITVKPRPVGGPVLSLFNPLAPMPPEPSNRWTMRAPWVAVAEKSGRAPSAVELRHEPRFGVMLCGW